MDVSKDIWLCVCLGVVGRGNLENFSRLQRGRIFTQIIHPFRRFRLACAHRTQYPQPTHNGGPSQGQERGKREEAKAEERAGKGGKRRRARERRAEKRRGEPEERGVPTAPKTMRANGRPARAL